MIIKTILYLSPRTIHYHTPNTDDSSVRMTDTTDHMTERLSHAHVDAE